MDSSDRIDSGNTKALSDAYIQLLGYRDAMLDAVAALPEQSRSVRQTIVDSLILGVLHRLHEVANNLDQYEQLVKDSGGGFGGYAAELVNEVHLVITQLKQGRATSDPAAPDKGIGKARAVRPQ